MHERYVRGDHPSSVALANNSTNFWKRMWSIINEVEPLQFWIVGKGDIDICLGSWLNVDFPILDAKIPFVFI